MKLSLVFFIFSSALYLFPFTSIKADPIPRRIKSFEEWCNQKDRLFPETKKTVEAMLKESGTNDCKLANHILLSKTELTISSYGDSKSRISDLKPFMSLASLKKLSLAENKISDIKPLGMLKNLTYLYLRDNQISDLQPLIAILNNM